MSVEKQPNTTKGWRGFTRRHAFIATGIIGAGVVVVLLLILFLFRLGYVDRYVANQIKQTFASYGVRAEIRDFHASFPPRTVQMDDVELYDSVTGDRLGKITRLLATIKIEDLYALNLQRNINLEDLKMEDVDFWVNFDNEGRSNFRNTHIPPPEPNRTILFA